MVSKMAPWRETTPELPRWTTMARALTSTAASMVALCASTARLRSTEFVEASQSPVGLGKPSGLFGTGQGP